jgi:RNA recognition motif-containing protein
MVSIKLPLVLVATIILAVIGFFTSSSVLDQDATTLQKSLFSVGVVANGLLIIILSSLTKTSSTVSETNESASIEGEDDIATLYVGNLPYRANEQVVKEHFENFGYVKSVRLMKDKRTGKRKGFGFVEVGVDAAESMIKKLNDSDFQERTIKVRPAKDKVA